MGVFYVGSRAQCVRSRGAVGATQRGSFVPFELERARVFADVELDLCATRRALVPRQSRAIRREDAKVSSEVRLEPGTLVALLDGISMNSTFGFGEFGNRAYEAAFKRALHFWERVIRRRATLE